MERNRGYTTGTSIMNTGNKTAFYITAAGRKLARKIGELYSGMKVMKFSRDAAERAWKKNDCLVFIMASGIVVRTIAPLLSDKKTDPAVVVLDQTGAFAISLLSGHLGGANDRAREIAQHLGGEAVITTASDAEGIRSLDLLARDYGLVIENHDALPRLGTRLIDRGKLKVYSDLDFDFPRVFSRTEKPSSADVLITSREFGGHGRIYLRPRNIVVGIGCNRGTSADEIGKAVDKALRTKNISFLSVCSLATIVLKKNEPGLKTFAKRNSLRILCYGPEELNRVAGVSSSKAALKATGAKAVAEPAALLASHASSLIIRKQKIGNVTVAAAELKAR